MPDWLDVFSSKPKSLASPDVRLDSRLGKVPLSQMIGEYKHAAQKHQDKVIALLASIDSVPSGKALLAELGGTGHTIRIMPYWHFFRTMPGGEYFNSTSIAVKPGESASYIADGTIRDDADAYEKGAPIRDENSEPMLLSARARGRGRTRCSSTRPKSGKARARTRRRDSSQTKSCSMNWSTSPERPGAARRS
jgi:hypothetical protein